MQPNDRPGAPVDTTPQVKSEPDQSLFSIRTFPKQPAAIISVKLIEAERTPHGSPVLVEIQNTSNQNITFVSLGTGPSEKCPDFMYRAIPSPTATFGAEQQDQEITTSVLEPNEKRQIKISSGEDLRKLLDPHTYESCPEDHKKPELIVARVKFADGTVWTPEG